MTYRRRSLINEIAKLGRRQMKAASSSTESSKGDQMISKQNNGSICSDDDTGIEEEELKSNGTKSELCDSGISTVSCLPVASMPIASESKSTYMVSGLISATSELESKKKSEQGLEQKSLLQQDSITSDVGACDPSHINAPSSPLKGHDTSHDDTKMPSNDSGARVSRRRSIWTELKRPIDKDYLRDEFMSLANSPSTQSSIDVPDSGCYHSDACNHGSNFSHGDGSARESFLLSVSEPSLQSQSIHQSQSVMGQHQIRGQPEIDISRCDADHGTHPTSDHSQPDIDHKSNSGLSSSDTVSNGADIDPVTAELAHMRSLSASRSRELMVANDSRVRMSQMLSEEELMKVAENAREKSEYKVRLEHAATPLTPSAWGGVVEEKIKLWQSMNAASR